MPGHKRPSTLLGVKSALAKQNCGKITLNEQQSGPFWYDGSMCIGVKIMIYKLWKKTGEAEGNKPKVPEGGEAILGSSEHGSGGSQLQAGKKQAFTPPSYPRDHVLRPAAWHALPTDGHIPW